MEFAPNAHQLVENVLMPTLVCHAQLDQFFKDQFAKQLAMVDTMITMLVSALNAPLDAKTVH